MPKLGFFALLAACTLTPVASTVNNPESLSAERLCNSLHWDRASTKVWYVLAQPGVSNASNRGHTSNTALVRVLTQTGERVWLIGQGPSPRFGQALGCSAKRQLGLDVTDTVSARAHPESVLGLIAFEHVRTWGWPVVQQAMRERCPFCTPALARASGDDSVTTEQIRIPGASLTAQALGAGSRPTAHLPGLTVYALARAADDWTTLVRDDASGTWMAPGLVWGPGVVPDLREASLAYMLVALDWLAQQRVQALVPEQGRVASTEVVATNMAYWRGLEQQLTQAIAAGRSLDDALVQQSMTNPAWRAIQAQANATQQILNRERHALNLQRAWRELEDAYFSAIKPR